MISRTQLTNRLHHAWNQIASRIWLIAVLLIFSALVVPTVGEGVGNWDGHKILLSVQALLDHHRVVLSRLPGHPTTDFYLFGAIGWVLDHGFGRRFDASVFLTLQWITAVATALVFNWWLERSGISRRRAALAVLCLLFSPQFFDQTMNGEEFIHGILFLLGAIVLLFRDEAPPLRFTHLGAAIGLFALATGCRPEFVLSGGIIFPAYLLRQGIRDWKIWLGTALAAVVTAALVWLPIVLTTGLVAAQDAQMDGPTKILGWGYKTLFLCFGFPTSLLLGSVVVGSLIALRRRAGKPTSADYTQWVSLAMVALYLGLFLFRPHKPTYVLVCVPFLLWLAARRAIGLLIATAVFTVAGLFVAVDIFRDRVLGAPHFVAGVYPVALSGKPVRQINYVTALSKIEVTTKSVIIGDVWGWVYLDLIERGAFSATQHPLGKRRGAGFVVNGDTNRILLPREFMWFPENLRHFHEEGYQIVMDRLMWRTEFAKYDVTTPTAGDVGAIGTIPVRLISVDAAPR